MTDKSYPYYLANRPISANSELPVVDKYTGKVATRVALTDAHGSYRIMPSKMGCVCGWVKPYRMINIVVQPSEVL